MADIISFIFYLLQDRDREGIPVLPEYLRNIEAFLYITPWVKVLMLNVRASVRTLPRSFFRARLNSSVETLEDDRI
jgi:hypothetical protein